MKKFQDIPHGNYASSEDDKNRAARVVCSMAGGIDDAKLLLESLGLISEPAEEEVVEEPEPVAAPPMSSKEFCNNNHPRTPENTMVRNGRTRRCIPCHKASVKKHAAKRTKQGGRSMRKTHCVNLHLWTPETTVFKVDGSRVCLVCSGER